MRAKPEGYKISFLGSITYEVCALGGRVDDFGRLDWVTSVVFRWLVRPVVIGSIAPRETIEAAICGLVRRSTHNDIIS